ncbi:phosphatase 2C-like domain-containing protein [Cokeromyces recurvatus]|uniref:phosphatase 2C-like domain-containing protein n=1 Tax=Cokeromyces recurvatus TaxID=90255 RepID=UPI00221FE6BE|nr:phosphatase 2C-like domain-containing protein [Cokeromyces recurvatus]KAI7906740.1 phosphatase 2C-like domain-containing protein [Cokeromyces recurvatus]
MDPATETITSPSSIKSDVNTESVAETPIIDTELAQLNICDQLRANSSFMKVMATLFHYGNQAMNAAQLVIAVRTLNLLPLRGETPKSTIQGIISTSRKIARDLKIPDPFRIDKDGAGRQAKYAISNDIMNGVQAPEIKEIPDEPIILRPVEYGSSGYYANQHAKRQRKAPSLYSPSTKLRQKKKSRVTRSKKKDANEICNSDVEIDSEDDESDFTSFVSEDDNQQPEIIEQDTIADYSLLYSPPTSDIDYIDRINFVEYPIASYFAIVQQKGYSYPRFRSHEKIKIPKEHCEDKFRVTDISINNKIMGRLFILADGHGGPGCSEYFVRKTPIAVNDLCAKYDPAQLGDTAIQKEFEQEIKAMIQSLDDGYLSLKRQQIATAKQTGGQPVDNDGCTLILNIFLGEWLINVNVGDSRTVLISAPEPSSAPPTSIENANTLGIDNDYKMDVVFASQDHKPYLEHLARHILENGGEFVDSVQNKVIKVELDKLREDGNRHAKRVALKNARIRPKDYQAGLDQSPTVTVDDASETLETTDTKIEDSNSTLGTNWTAQSAVRTTVSSPPITKNRSREDRIPSLNVARSCGDLDFKMDPLHKIISCEPDVTFIRISDQPYIDHTVLLNGPHKEKRRHFLFMSTDGTFDYMYEETAERQNRAIAKVIGPMIEDGEKIGKYLLEEEERIQGQTIEHNKEVIVEEKEEEKDKIECEKGDESKIIIEKMEEDEQIVNKEELVKDEEMKDDNKVINEAEENKKEENSDSHMDVDITETPKKEEEPEELPRIPLLLHELTEEEAKARKIKERTLVSSARYFANRESAHGFFASTLQDYDDCTIILVEI